MLELAKEMLVEIAEREPGPIYLKSRATALAVEDADGGAAAAVGATE